MPSNPAAATFGTALDSGAARRAARSARPVGTARARTRFGRRRSLPSRSSRGARPRRDAARRLLTALVRKDLLRPEQPQLAGEDGYRFRHLLIRDAAYEALPKATRAELHGLFASWLERHGAALVELDEILGYHLEQAFRYRRELGPVSDDDREDGRPCRGAARPCRKARARPRRSGGRNRPLRARRALLPEPSASSLRHRSRAGGASGTPASTGKRARSVLERALDEAETLNARGPRVTGSARALIRQNHDGDRRGRRCARSPGPDRHLGSRAARRRRGVGRAWFVLATTYWVRARWDDMRGPLSRSIAYAERPGTAAWSWKR